MHLLLTYAVIYCIPSESSWINKVIFIFWRKHQTRGTNPLKALLGFLQHVTEKKTNARPSSYQHYWIKPLWASIQSLEETIWQILIGAADILLGNSVWSHSTGRLNIRSDVVSFYCDSASTACLIPHCLLFQFCIGFCNFQGLLLIIYW